MEEPAALEDCSRACRQTSRGWIASFCLNDATQRPGWLWPSLLPSQTLHGV